MMNALTYLTRRCPRECGYCALRDAKDVGPELKVEQWQEAFAILDKLGVKFNLILGNETWLLRDALVKIMSGNKVPYALYTTAPEPLFSQCRSSFFKAGIDNFSCGVDWPLSYLKKYWKDGETEEKSWCAWQAFKWVKKHYPNVDCHGTVTVHRGNFELLPDIVNELSALGVFVAVNFIHWNTDGKFDFFPPKSEMGEYIIPADIEYTAGLRKVIDKILAKPGRLQNLELLNGMTTAEMLTLSWHCKGDPYGGPTIDSDGTLRVCGYRKGEYTSQFTIFDLPDKLKEWREAVEADAENCPGCAWSYPWTYRYWKTHDSQMGEKVFTSHAGLHIPENQWSRRLIDSGRKDI